MGAGVFGISVHRRPCDGLFRGRCVYGVLCMCCCRYRKRRWQGSSGGSGCKRVMLVCVGISSSDAGGMRWCVLGFSDGYLWGGSGV
jgi:hypothetical protein